MERDCFRKVLSNNFMLLEGSTQIWLPESINPWKLQPSESKDRKKFLNLKEARVLLLVYSTTELIWCLPWIRTIAFFLFPDSSECWWPGSRHWTSESWEPENWKRGRSLGMRCNLSWSHQLANQDDGFIACNFSAKWPKKKSSVVLFPRVMTDN